MTVPVLAAPLLSPDAGRIDLELPDGLTLAEIVARALPGLPESAWSSLRLTLVGAGGAMPIAPALWHRIRPRAGIRVVIRALPGDDALGSLLMVVVSVAALALGQYWAGLIIPQAGFGQQILGGVIAGGLTIVGSMLVSALVPVPKVSEETRRNRYTIGGWRNDERPDQPLPEVMGRIRYAPPYAAASYTEIVGNDQYVRAMFCFGAGPVDLSELKIGETAIDNYDDVEIEIREGRPGDPPCLLYPRQVLEEAASVELTRPRPRDAYGEVISGPAIETPVLRWSAHDSWGCTVIIGFPSGLFELDDDGDVESLSVAIRIRQRLPGDTDWSDVVELNISADERDMFFRAHTWLFPSRGRWEIEVTRMTDERTSTRVADRTMLSALQSIRPEYPIASATPLALVAMRVRATHQLSGPLDTFSAVVQRYGRVWNGAAWVEGLSRNPATAMLRALQGPQNPFPATDEEIYLDQIADWYEWCELHRLKYDRVHDQDEDLQTALAAICAAGRATPRHDGLKWGVVIDRPETLVVDHINPRNAGGFSWSRQYFDPPHAFRVAFQDETSDWQSAERIVPWPGHVGEISLTETLALPGKTDPDEIWRETRRRMYELIHRPDTFAATQSGLARVATRGDLVIGSWDVLDRMQRAARVTRVLGALVELDEAVEMAEGESYGLRWRVYDEEDTVGVSVLRPVVTEAGQSRLVRLAEAEPAPAVGDLVHFGPMSTQSAAFRVKGVEAGEEMTSILRLVAAAPEIDDLIDAEEIPDWSGRVGSILDDTMTPVAPRIVRARSSWETVLIPWEDDPDGGGRRTDYYLDVTMVPGEGETAYLQSFRFEWRETSASGWVWRLVPTADGTTRIGPFAAGTTVQMRAAAISIDGTVGPPCPTLAVPVELGATFPEAIPLTGIEIEGGYGAARIAIAVPGDPTIVAVQAYRVPSGEPPAFWDVAGRYDVSPGDTVSAIAGDGTRRNLLTNGGFEAADDWTAAGGWTIASMPGIGGAAVHTPGAESILSQARAPVAGATYHLSFTVSGRTAGSVTPQFIGGSTTVAGSAVTADGLQRQPLVAAAGNTALAFFASADFDGTIDDVAIWQDSATAIDPGDYDYWFETINAAGGSSSVTGPVPVTIL
ncbi:TipJ family phage tail tip protein [Frigidibacter oleivorans]|uniref:TipJ family phage tail tip protein n=1 Tax=Frigidibacter oleivorans TaxID=2487129 RepID=UPI000F8D85F8|nr:phage tail protein [Frigidibacter oleivorans]